MKRNKTVIEILRGDDYRHRQRSRSSDRTTDRKQMKKNESLNSDRTDQNKCFDIGIQRKKTIETRFSAFKRMKAKNIDQTEYTCKNSNNLYGIRQLKVLFSKF